VKFTVTQTPPSRASGSWSVRQAARGQGSTVEIEGPKGRMRYEIPAYMTLSGEEGDRVRTLSILDAEDRKQREMWGE
jgi:large subunit ribosomal protein L6